MQFLKRTLLLAGALLPAVLGAPMHNAALEPEIIPGSYIVTFKQDVAAAKINAHTMWATDLHRRNKQLLALPNGDTNMGIQHNYQINGFAAYSGSFDDMTINAIRNHEDVCSSSQI